MDSLTHIVVGACIGEGFLGKQLGKKAMFLGAVAQSLPDVDFLASFWLNTTDNLLAHRGFTHSVLFTLLVTPFLALLSERSHRVHNVKLISWILFWGIQGLFHIFLDGFNAYGVGWLEPFSHQRFSFNVLFVADPFFSLWPFISFCALLLLPRAYRYRALIWVTGLLASGAYLVYAISNKVSIERDVKLALKEQRISYKNYFTTPTPLNNWLWYVAAGDTNGFFIGYRSVFDTEDKINWRYFPRNRYLLKDVDDHESLQHLIRFSKGFYTVAQSGDSLVFNDLRFGQIAGWRYPDERFIFHYYLHRPDNNKLVVQRSRFERWDKKTIKSLWIRIKGN